MEADGRCLFGGEEDGGKRELVAILQSVFRRERLDNHHLQPQRGFFMGTKRLKMTRGVIVDLLHKVGSSPCAVPGSDTDDGLLNVIICCMGAGGGG